MAIPSEIVDSYLTAENIRRMQQVFRDKMKPHLPENEELRTYIGRIFDDYALYLLEQALLTVEARKSGDNMPLRVSLYETAKLTQEYFMGLRRYGLDEKTGKELMARIIRTSIDTLKEVFPSLPRTLVYRESLGDPDKCRPPQR